MVRRDNGSDVHCALNGIRIIRHCLLNLFASVRYSSLVRFCGHFLQDGE